MSNPHCYLWNHSQVLDSPLIISYGEVFIVFLLRLPLETITTIFSFESHTVYETITLLPRCRTIDRKYKRNRKLISEDRANCSLLSAPATLAALFQLDHMRVKQSLNSDLNHTTIIKTKKGEIYFSIQKVNISRPYFWGFHFFFLLLKIRKFDQWKEFLIRDKETFD